jgi:hypothetical protein
MESSQPAGRKIGQKNPHLLQQPQSNKKYYIIPAIIILGVFIVLVLIIIGIIPNPINNNNSVNCDGEWEPCSATCGTGTTKYKIKTHKQGNGASCPEIDGALKSCKDKDCAVNCIGEWETCSATCGNGKETYRIKTIKQGDGASCPYVAGFSRTCKIKACPLIVTPTSGYIITSFTDTNKNVYEIYIFKDTTTYTIEFPEKTICDILVVGGGGGGGNWAGGNYECGGGGAGAYLYKQNITFEGKYLISVGKGGEPSNKGENSEIRIFGPRTPLYICEGGGNGGFNADNAGNGGSGGGGIFGHNNYGKANDPNKGFDGAIGTTNAGANDGGGGGGAGGPGIFKHGGIGKENNITGNNLYYAGGGGACSYHSSGGGTGGSGIGGTGSTASSNAKDGEPNTGSGGGGGYLIGPKQGGKGGSGVVILRYKTIDGTCT